MKLVHERTAVLNVKEIFKKLPEAAESAAFEAVAVVFVAVVGLVDESDCKYFRLSLTILPCAVAPPSLLVCL